MKGLILAAGRGSRLGRITDDLPKGMARVGGRSLLEWQLAALHGAGVSEVALVRGHRADALPRGLPAFDNPRWHETGIVASLACASEWLLSGPTIVGYSDLVYPARAVELLCAARGDIAVLYDPAWLALWRLRFDDPTSDGETFRVDERGLVATIGGRISRLEDVQGQYMGLFRLTPEGAARVLAHHRSLDEHLRDRIDVTRLLARLVDGGEPVSAVAYDSWWCEVDRPGDLAVAEAILAREVGS